MSTGDTASSASEGYDLIADRFDAERGPKPWEWPFFEALAATLSRGSRVLDCGCGSGHLGLTFLLDAGHVIEAIVGSFAMLALFQQRYPTVVSHHADFRLFPVEGMFDAIIAWDSFFHLSKPDQTEMIARFGDWLRPGGRILFTSGPSEGSVQGEMFGVPFSYSSFGETGYRDRLARSGFVEVESRFDEPGADIHKVWTAVKG